MRTCRFHRFMLALLAVAGLAVLGFALVCAASGLGLVGWMSRYSPRRYRPAGRQHAQVREE